MVALTLGGLHSSGVVVEADMIMMMDVTCLLPVRVIVGKDDGNFCSRSASNQCGRRTGYEGRETCSYVALLAQRRWQRKQTRMNNDCILFEQIRLDCESAGLGLRPARSRSHVGSLLFSRVGQNY